MLGVCGMRGMCSLSCLYCMFYMRFMFCSLGRRSCILYGSSINYCRGNGLRNNCIYRRSYCGGSKFIIQCERRCINGIHQQNANGAEYWLRIEA